MIQNALYYTPFLKKYFLLTTLTFFSDKISKIRDSGCFTLPAPPVLPKFGFFKSVSEDEVQKVIIKSGTKSCLLDPWPTFLAKGFLYILLPSFTKLVNYFLTEGAGLKKAIVSPFIKEASLPPNEFKNYQPVSGLASSVNSLSM